MRYKVEEYSDSLVLNVEATFTLIDFTVLIVCFILGFIFAVFFWIFFIAVFIKVFSSNEFEFDLDRYQGKHSIRWFSYFKLKRRDFSFSEIQTVRFSNEESGNALQETMKMKEWYTIDIILDNNYTRIVKVPEDELDDADELFFVLKEYLGEYFKFDTEIISINQVKEK